MSERPLTLGEKCLKIIELAEKAMKEEDPRRVRQLMQRIHLHSAEIR